MNQPPVTIPGEAHVQRPEAPSLTREVFDHREQPSAYGFNPQDGLPRPVAETSTDDTVVLPLHPDTFVCMADYTVFYLRSYHGQGPSDVIAEFKPDEVQRTAAGFWVPTPLALERVGADRAHLVFLAPNGLTPVEPKRRQCKHYARQMTDFSGRRRGFVARMCLALRDESGEYQSLRDTGLYACELRDPPDALSTETLDEFDARKVREGLERSRDESKEGSFDIDAALFAQPLNGLLVGNWMPHDAVPKTNRHLHVDGGLLLGENGMALDMIPQSGGGWSVLASEEVQQLAHSRHWPQINDRDEYVFVTWSGAPPNERRRVFRVTQVTTGHRREDIAAHFGEAAAARATKSHVVLLDVEEQQEQEP